MGREKHPEIDWVPSHRITDNIILPLRVVELLRTENEVEQKSIFYKNIHVKRIQQFVRGPKGTTTLTKTKNWV